ncbi:MAG: GTP 3',8-cyclase MoaA [Butyricicoccus sp.]
MHDWMGRELNYLRLSLTERCNLHCLYCRDGEEGCPIRSELTLEELKTLTACFVRLGVTKVRLTGGEPLLRDDLEQIVQMLSGFPQIADLAMTTNAQGLAERLPALQRAGLRRVNISLDSLDEATYRRITRGGQLHQVWDGIHAALRAGMPVKLNTVLMQGVNDGEVDDFLRLAKEYPLEIRFIELMPFSHAGQQTTYQMDGEVILSRHPELRPIPCSAAAGPAQRYCAEGYCGTVGLIRPISHAFCRQCNRIRVTSTGKLRMCLGQDEETDLRSLLHGSEEELEQALRTAVYRKPEQHCFASGQAMRRSMNQIGG